MVKPKVQTRLQTLNQAIVCVRIGYPSAFDVLHTTPNISKSIVVHVKNNSGKRA